MSKLMSVLFIFLAFEYAYSQDSLTMQDLEPYTYYFSIENNKIVEDGVAFLQKEAEVNQYFLLGEYHHSKRISQLTKALIPLLNDNGYKHFGLEIGPNTARNLENLPPREAQLVNTIKVLNTQYKIKWDENYTQTPIPFFGNVSDAEFLSQAKQHNWHLLGLDQEFNGGFAWLIETAYKDLGKNQQERLKTNYSKLIDTLSHYNQLNTIRGTDFNAISFSELVKKSEFCQQFFDEFAKTNKQNEILIRNLKRSIEIYLYSISTEYWISNNMRAQNFIDNLHEGFLATEFDLSKDKMLFKLGGLHTMKGNHYQIYDLGNTVFELARFHGNSSVHFSFYYPRYEYENDTLTDRTKSSTRLTNDDKTILQMSKKDEWTIIDLRPLKRKLYYPRLQQFKRKTNEMFQEVDVILIPPIEVETTSNINQN